MQTLRTAAGRFAVAALLFGLIAVDHSSRAGILGRRVRNRCCLPNYAYGSDAVTVSDSVITQAGTAGMTEETVILVLESPKLSRHPVQEAAIDGLPPAASESVLKNQVTTNAISASVTNPKPAAVAGPIVTQTPASSDSGVANSVIVRRKRFTLPATKIGLGGPNANVKLSQIGLAIYETGQLACSGTVSHNGGPGGTVLGNRVTIWVRGYGANGVATAVPPSGPLLFETSETFWINRNEQMTISLSPHEACERIRRHFDEIGNLEVKLSYRQDR